MIPLAAKALLGGLGLAGLLALAGSKPASAAPAGGGALPSDLVSRMVAALASKDPAAMRTLARELRGRGFNDDAAKLEAAAQLLEGKGQGGGSSSSSSSSSPPSTSPGTPAAPGPVSDAKQLLAAAVANSITTGKPDVQKLRLFQTQEGLTPDGVYGPKTATALIKYGIVPPTPTAWPKANAAAAKSAYVGLLKLQADKDPLRREEWLQAAGAVAGATATAKPAAAKPSAVAPASGSAPFAGKAIPVLRQGSRGPNVVFLKRLLNQNGAAIVQDENFTAATKQTVMSFQKGRKDKTGKPLVPDGVVGEKTWWALGAFN